MRYEQLLTKLSRGDRKTSYAQCGEDLIVEFIFEASSKFNPTYLDLGAYHPKKLSNTYLFYVKGCRGVCVEPDPVLHAKIAGARRGDVCLNVGVGFDERQAATSPFYIMSAKTLNTFSREDAERYQRYGSHKIERVVEVPLLHVNKIIEQHFAAYPNFVSLDVEGLDLKVLQALDFARFRPEVFCVETLTYAEDKTEEKLTDTIDFMLSQGYFVYADTYINTIFVDKDFWKNR